MAKLQENNINKTTATVDRVGLCIVITTVIIILVVVISGICVRFLLEETLSRIILIALICFLCVLGMIVLFILELRRRKAAKAANNGVVTLRNGQYYNIQPSAPQDTSWEYSNRATVPA